MQGLRSLVDYHCPQLHLSFFFYKLTGKTKDDIHNAVLEQRAKLAAEKGEAVEENAEEA